MSGASEEYERLNELGLTSIPNRSVCVKHIDELGIKNFIRKTSSKGFCDYCERDTAVIQLEDLMEFIMRTIAYFYTDPANFMSYNSREGGYLGNLYDSDEILQEYFDLDIPETKLFNDVFNSLDYSKAWANEMEYYDSPSDILIYSWEYFKKVAKHRSRYFFGQVRNLHSNEYRLSPDEILKEIGNCIKKYKLIKSIPPGIAIYRCRQHSRKDISVKTSEGMCSPPTDLALNANRMSPAGISMFYGAFDPETSIKETVDSTNKKSPYCTTVAFTAKKGFRVIDLSSIPNLPSPFDETKRKHFYPITFFRDFVRDLAAPVEKDNQAHINYVPTQVITEYFRYPFSDTLKGGKIDGIIYPSSKTGRKACVLFVDNKESLEVLEFNIKSIVRHKI